MRLLTTLELRGLPLSSVAAASAILHPSCQALTSLVVDGSSSLDELAAGPGGLSKLWDSVFFGLSGARSLRRLSITDCVVCEGSFSQLGSVDQLHSLSLTECGAPEGATAPSKLWT